MESLEMLIAFTIFLYLFSTYLSNIYEIDNDYTLTQYVVAEDIWRVLYLKYNIEFYYPSLTYSELRNDLNNIAEELKMCITFKTANFYFTSNYCRGERYNVIKIKEERINHEYTELILS